jgi:hypothetical protein
MRAQNQQQDAHRDASTRARPSKLDDRYGKIGIPAVAAAVRCRGEKRKAERARLVPQDCD